MRSDHTGRANDDRIQTVANGIQNSQGCFSFGTVVGTDGRFRDQKELFHRWCVPSTRLMAWIELV